MSYVQAAVLIVVFFVFYRWVVPRLFPSVVSGVYVVDPSKHGSNRHRQQKKGDDGDGVLPTSHVAAESNEPLVIKGGALGLVGGGHRTQVKGDLRRRNAESRSAMV